MPSSSSAAAPIIVADENIPFAREWFGALGEVRTHPGRTLDAAAVAAADVLLVRSVTRVDAQLLAGSAVGFVGTATIGTDHLDLEYLQSCGIAVASAPASNAQSVVDYVLSALATLDGELERLLTGGATVGVVGLGNVGGRLLRRLRQLGINASGYDPYVSADDLPQAALEVVLGCDVVCLHTPLTRGGEHPTFHLLDARRLANLRPGAVLLNAGRGAVIDNQALLDALRRRPDLRVVLDVWEGEPDINAELLRRVTLATPHIAGYSLDGKLTGTRMLLAAYCAFSGVVVPVLPDMVERPVLQLSGELNAIATLCAALLATYDPRRDDQALRANPDGVSLAQHFDRLRKHYPVRREVATYVIDASQLPAETRILLAAAGFDCRV